MTTPEAWTLVIACHDRDLENLARMNMHLPDGTRLFAADTKRSLRLRGGSWTDSVLLPPATAPHRPTCKCLICRPEGQRQ